MRIEGLRMTNGGIRRAKLDERNLKRRRRSTFGEANREEFIPSLTMPGDCHAHPELVEGPVLRPKVVAKGSLAMTQKPQRGAIISPVIAEHFEHSEKNGRADRAFDGR